MRTIRSKVALIAVLMAILGPSFATDLLCTGRAWIERGDGFESSVLIRLDPTTLRATLQLLNGVAQGSLTQNGQIYTGTFTFPNGQQVWINLDRYTGELVVAHQPSTGVVAFMGTCESAQPKF